MRIGFDVAQTCGERAGCGWYADALIRALVKISPQHQYFLYHQFGGWINDSISNGTSIAAPNVTSIFKNCPPAEAKRIWHELPKLGTKIGHPDIVHANCYQAPIVSGAKLVYTIYDVSFWAVPEFTTEANRLICQGGVLSALQNADGVIFISQSARDEFERMLPGWLEHSGMPCAITPLAAKTLPKHTPKPPAQGQYWLSVGSLEPRKNYDTLLDAIALYWERSQYRLPLKIAGGKGWKSDALQARIRELSRRGMVDYLGYVPDQGLSNLYAGAEAFIFPSWYEGFGLPVLEAMAHGCPVISSDRTSLKEVGGNGVLYVDPANASAISTLMLTLESDPGLRSKIAQAGLVQAAKFDWQHTAKQTLEFYERVLGS
jgi:glycosyltransferase involved in cell wall biosynthesis